MFQKRAHGESGRARQDAVGPFREELNGIVNTEGLLLRQVYNFDETALFWSALPTSTKVFGRMTQTKGCKLDKSRISVLVGANADGSHCLPPIVCGKSARPRALKDCMASLPVPYHSSGKGWFNAPNFKETFFKHIVPAIIRHQKEVLKISEERIRALILLDNDPAHPCKGRLVAHNGKIRVLFLPANTSSLIQPMGQGVIHATKLIYRRLFLSEVLVVEETPEDLVEDIRALRTLEKLKAYNIKQAIFNFSEAWKQVKSSTLTNAWKRLLYDVHVPVVDFAGFEVQDFRRMFNAGGEDVANDDVQNWLERDEGDPGHELLSKEEIIETVLKLSKQEEDSDKEENTCFTIKMSTAREYLDQLITFVDQRPKDFSIVDYDQQRSIRQKVTELRHTTGKQTSITSFFRPRTPTPSTTPVTSPEPSDTSPQLPFYPGSPQPSTSGVQQPFPALVSEEDSE